MAEPVYTLTKVNYAYPGNIPALAGITLTISWGDRVAFIGANGTGKSTLLTLLDALIFADTGTMTAFGNKITERGMNDAATQRSFRTKVGFVFQNPDIQLFCPTVREDILFGPLQLGVDKEDILRRFELVADQMHIRHLLDRSPHQLSIGEKKKIAIAGVLIMEPAVLLLDEPTAGLDPQTTRDIIAVLVAAHKEGKTVVMATHDLHIAEEIADTVHVFGPDKTIIRSGPPEEILTDNAFLQAHNLIHQHVHRHAQVSHVHAHGHPHPHPAP
ncbi:MAG: energy-coupling factor ABC transporter ATP-binding protein [Chitinispirillaceae bacterium]|jgi:cobalt/nickel transport system ATP-binding protein|nr:energy-coupling factor ABC transporter ATP-binding protein [Chitinispirillaceae bacterium]